MGGGGHAVVGHQADSVVDGVDKDTHVPHHGDAVSGLGRAVQQLLDVAVGLAGVQAALGDGDQRFAAAVLRQAQHRAGVALGKVIVQHKLPLVCRQLQKPQLVGKGRLRHAQTLGGFGLGAVPQHSKKQSTKEGISPDK